MAAAPDPERTPLGVSSGDRVHDLFKWGMFFDKNRINLNPVSPTELCAVKAAMSGAAGFGVGFLFGTLSASGTNSRL